MSEPAYVEFAVQSNFSFLRGASRPEELVVAAQMLGFQAIGLADRNTVAGVVRAWSQSKATRFPYHPGCRLSFADGTPDVLAYPRDREGWGYLCRLLTQANIRDESEKGASLVYRDDLIQWGDRMALAVIPPLAAEVASDLDLIGLLKDRFGKAVRLAVAPGYGGNDRLRIEQAAALAEAADVPLMAINDVLYHAVDRRTLQDVLTAIRLNKPITQAGYELFANAERHLKPPAEMSRSFRRHPDALVETLRFRDSLGFSLKALQYNYPDEPTESGLPPQDELERLTWIGAADRFPGGIPSKVEKTIRHEIATVRELGYARYFLTVYNIMNFARSRGILCQGRGSAANSLICYCLRITDVGPDIVDTLFERFISKERNEPPDIDVDFEHERREEVIQHIYETYKDKHTALAASVTTYRGRSALREVGKALGLSDDVQAAMSGSLWGWHSSTLGKKETEAGGLHEADPLSAHVLACANEIMGFPRHLSQHTGGFVITRDRLDEIVPIMKTAMPQRKMVEWDKDDLDAVGLLKIDVLALGMLSCLKRAFDLLEKLYPEARDKHGRPLDLATIPPEDKRVYEMICRADTLGVFQIESRAQMSMLPRLRPEKFYDLVIEVAIVRPGPIQGDMVHPYLRRRQGKEAVDYVHPELEEILGRTKGVPLFQEQAMRIAIVAGGFQPGEADELRRAMATFKRTGTIGNYKAKLIDGMVAKNYPREFAERCFKQIEGFGEYGFPESHAASFALLVYASCWFKAFYPDVFCAAILNSQPMGFYAPAQLVRDAVEHGVEIGEVDVNLSDWDCTLEESPFDPDRIALRHASMRDVILSRHAVRLGFRQVKGLGEKRMRTFVENRGTAYASVHDVWLRSGLDLGEIEKLAEADAFRSIGLDRRQALWEVRALSRRKADASFPLLDRPQLDLLAAEPRASLPLMPAGEHVIHDYRSLGLSLKAHPFSFIRARLDRAGVTPNAVLPDIKDKSRVTVAGLVLVRQRPGKGNAIFLTLEDDKAIANIIIWARDFERFRPVFMGSRCIRVTGRLQSEASVIHIVAEKMDDLTPWLSALSEKAASLDTLARADEVKHPGIDQRQKPRRSHRPPMPNASDGNQDVVSDTAGVMPKGRNFH